jgi:hypothetical protein
MDFLIGVVAEGDRYWTRSDVERRAVPVADEPVWLLAPRKFGKSSLLKRLATEARDEFVVTAGVSAAAGEDDLFFMLYHALQEELTTRGVCENQTRAMAERYREALERGDRERFDFQHEFERALEEIAETVQPIFLLDDADYVFGTARKREGDEAAKRLFERVAEVASSPHTRFLLTGMPNLPDVADAAGAGETFDRFREVALPELSREEASDYLDFLLDRCDISLPTPSRETLFEAVGQLTPYWVVLVVNQLCKLMTREDPKVATRGMVLMAAEKTLSYDSYFAPIVGALRALFEGDEFLAARQIVGLLADGERAAAEMDRAVKWFGVDAADIRERLVRYGYLSEERKGRQRLRSELFRRRLARIETSE